MKNFLLLYFLTFIIFAYSLDTTDDKTKNINVEKELQKIIDQYETDNPSFSQKGGMLRAGEHSFYIRTNDEWTGFSTFKLGYRYAPTSFFNIAIEGGISPIPYVFIGAIVLHFSIYESPNKAFFIGSRFRFGYKYQDSDFNRDEWEPVVGKNYLKVKRQSIYIAPDFTASLRFGPYKRFSLYYTIYPRFDIGLFDHPSYVMFSPGMIGFEVRFGYRKEWSFAIESGYTFPIPWDSVPQGQWVNFPSLANIGLHYKFGDKFYSKKNLDRIRESLNK